MDIALHLGVHQTDGDHLLRCLIRNSDRLARQGIAVPAPGKYRQQLRKVSLEMREHETNAATQEALLDGILDHDSARRVVFSWDSFLAMPKFAISDGRLYHAAGERATLLRRLFPEAEVSLFVAIRNPATFLPALARTDETGHVEAEVLKGDPTSLRWSAMLTRITTVLPGVPLTVWADEDTPLLWPEILRAVSGHAPDMVLEGWLGWYWDLVTPKGHEAMRRWFSANPPQDDLSRRKMLSALISRFARPDVVAGEPALAQWDEDTIDAINEAYEEDLDLIAALPGVTFLEP